MSKIVDDDNNTPPAPSVDAKPAVCHAPVSLADVIPWAARHEFAPAAALTRLLFVEVLRRLVEIESLGEHFILRGGNALDLVWFPNRTSADIDIIIHVSDSMAREFGERLRDKVAMAFVGAVGPEGIRATATSVEVLTRGVHGQFTVVRASIEVESPDAAQDDPATPPVTVTVGIDFGLNDLTCEAAALSLPGGRQIKVASLDDMIAEKLYAALYRRSGGQDFVDIGAMLLERVPFNLPNIRSYLLAKCVRRKYTITPERWREPEFLRRVADGYDDLRPHVRRLWVGYDDAVPMLQGLVDELARIGDFSITERTAPAREVSRPADS